jgi:lysophospholipase L1-like esterase
VRFAYLGYEAGDALGLRRPVRQWAALAASLARHDAFPRGPAGRCRPGPTFARLDGSIWRCKAMPMSKNNLNRTEFPKAVRDNPKAKRALCFGDSWFQYVPHPTDLNKQLARIFRKTLFLNEGLAGRDSAKWKAALPRIKRHIENYQFDAILLSTGGNDVVGEELKEFAKEADLPQSPPRGDLGIVPPEVRDHIRLDAFQQALTYAIRDLARIVEFRDLHSPHSVVYVHTYDYIFPNGKPFKLGLVKFKAPVKPTLDSVGLTDPKKQRIVTNWLVDQFARELAAFASQKANMVLVDSRGTLKLASQWENEIHPTRKGFEKIARERWQPALENVLGHP